MKALIKILFIISMVSVFLSSCSNDKDDTNKFFRKTIEITEDGTATTTFFKYDKYNINQIVSSDSPKKHIDYTYKEGLISKIVIKDKETQLSVTLDYTYSNKKLLRINSSDHYVINYTHNADGTVSYEKLTLDSQNQETKVFHGTLYFENKNLIKDERILDDTAPDILVVQKISFEYDTQKNPFRSILGYDKLLDHNEVVSLNNNVMTIVEVTETDTKDNQIISSVKLCQNVYKYDVNGYPVEMVYETSISNPNYLKTQYFY